MVLKIFLNHRICIPCTPSPISISPFSIQAGKLLGLREEPWLLRGVRARDTPELLPRGAHASLLADGHPRHGPGRPHEHR